MDTLAWIVAGLIAVTLLGAGVYLYTDRKRHAEKLAQDPALRQYQPGEMVTTTLTGITSKRQRALAERLSVGEELILARENDHPQDPHAIQAIYAGHETNLSDTVLGSLDSQLATRIAPIFDQYAVGAHRYVFARVVRVQDGVQITFQLPSEEDLKLQRDKRSIEKFL